MPATPQDWEARLNHMPTYHLVQLVTLTSQFVDLVRERWAAGRPVPARCTREWIDDLDAKVAGAERVIARRTDALEPPG
jgi:hypothetical protein